MDLAELIGNYCFPIAACVYLAWENRAQRQSHKEEADTMRTALEANTMAINRLVDRMED